MGKTCCGGPANLTYQHNGKLQKIPVKDATTINRFAAGATARIHTKHKKEELAKEIASLPKPTLFGVVAKKDETLMT